MHFSKKRKNIFWIFLYIFQIYIKFWTFSKEDNPYSLCISEIAYSEIIGSKNVEAVPFDRIRWQAMW